eukprot:6188821-Pleurochrysis_carterae.AAC.3
MLQTEQKDEEDAALLAEELEGALEAEKDSDKDSTSMTCSPFVPRRFWAYSECSTGSSRPFTARIYPTKTTSSPRLCYR